MPDYTGKLRLVKPREDEYYDVKVFNANSDAVDAAIAAIDAIVNHDLGGEPYVMNLQTMDGLIVTGVANEAEGRIEG